MLEEGEATMKIIGLPEEELKCGDYFVAYFDILGTKANLKNNENETLSKLWLVGHYIKKHRSRDVIIRTFSDNFLFAVKVDKDNPGKSMNTLFNMASGFAAECLSIFELLVRGAIVRGPLHIDTEIILGKSLIRAYELESKIALYPRIIIDNGVLDVGEIELIPIRKFDKPFFRDTDSSLCVNILFFLSKEQREAFKNRIVNNIIHSAILSHSNKDDSSILKVEWVKNYVNEFYFQNHGHKLIVFGKNTFKSK